MMKRHSARTSLAAGALVALATATWLSAQTPSPNAAGTPPVPAIPPPGPSSAELMAPPAHASKLPSGIPTLLLRAGDGGDTPRPHDFVVFRSIGRRRDGAVVQNGFGTREASRASLAQLGKIWIEGLGAMQAGEQRRFWFPAELMPKDPATGVQEPVVFDVELVSFVKLPAPPKSLKTPDPKAKRSGAASILITQPGQDQPRATRTDGAMMEFTLWNGQGAVVHSSKVDGRPTLFPLDKVMPSFADCVEGMAVAERRLCWIPALANSGFPGALKGDLVFELELQRLVDLTKLAPAPKGAP